ncbi:MAG: GntR family transcriptional regulator [Gemmatimonadaceae bacterium]|nr:GntR family transcriptional regulator [Gemmatimonadaceae bacterium]
MFERIDSRSSTPIYAQIAARIRVAVAAGELAAGEALPSVRVLATRLRVNPATVVQAYRELEQDGLVELRQGSGTFVRDLSPDRRQRERRTEATRLVRDLLADAARRGITPAELRTAFDEVLS